MKNGKDNIPPPSEETRPQTRQKTRQRPLPEQPDGGSDTVRAEKVAAVREAIRLGTFRVSAAKVAEKMIAETEAQIGSKSPQRKR